MRWFWFWFAFAIANAAAFAFHLALRRGRRTSASAVPPKPTLAWLLCSLVIILSPCCIPSDARALRFVDCVAVITLLLKVYDAYREPTLAAGMDAAKWVAYLPNWFWFVLKRVPRARPATSDWRRVALTAPLMIAAVALADGLLRLNWTGVPFAIEHAAKVLALATAVILIGQTFAALYRQLLGPALDPFDHPYVSRTPADFWRRWNRSFRGFFDEHVFRPSGGARHPVRATLAVFAVSGLMHEYVFDVAIGRVQGWQMLFFMLQGIAAAATLRIRPTRWAASLWRAGTLLFNLATSAIFCRSVDGVIAFYQR